MQTRHPSNSPPHLEGVGDLRPVPASGPVASPALPGILSVRGKGEGAGFRAVAVPLNTKPLFKTLRCWALRLRN